MASISSILSKKFAEYFLSCICYPYITALFWQLHNIKSPISSPSSGSRGTLSCPAWEGNRFELSSISLCQFPCGSWAHIRKETNVMLCWYIVLAPSEKSHFIAFCRKIKKETSMKNSSVSDSPVTACKMLCEMLYLHFSFNLYKITEKHYHHLCRWET